MLTETYVLRLDKNQLRGPIPTEIGQLTRNTNLALSENSLSGSLPTELALLATGIAGYPKLFVHDNEDLCGPLIPIQLGEDTDDDVCGDWVGYCSVADQGYISACPVSGTLIGDTDPAGNTCEVGGLYEEGYYTSAAIMYSLREYCPKSCSPSGLPTQKNHIRLRNRCDWSSVRSTRRHPVADGGRWCCVPSSTNCCLSSTNCCLSGTNFSGTNCCARRAFGGPPQVH